LQLIEL